MTTKFVSVKEFRQNMASFAARARSGKERIIVMSRTTPLFELKPFSDDDNLSKLVADIEKAREDVKHGRVYTHDQVMKMLSLD